MADTDQIEAIRAHVEKHKDRERAMFTVAGVSAILSELSRLTEAEKREPTDKQVKRATAEYLSYCGENPYRVLRGGQELWEARAPAMREAFRAARRALQGSDNG